MDRQQYRELRERSLQLEWSNVPNPALETSELVETLFKGSIKKDTLLDQDTQHYLELLNECRTWIKDAEDRE